MRKQDFHSTLGEVWYCLMVHFYKNLTSFQTISDTVNDLLCKLEDEWDEWKRKFLRAHAKMLSTCLGNYIYIYFASKQIVTVQ